MENLAVFDLGQKTFVEVSESPLWGIKGVTELESTHQFFNDNRLLDIRQ